MARNVIKWLIFSVAASAVPLLFSMLNLFVLKNEPWDPARLIGNGELFLIAVTLCAGGLGEALDAPGDRVTTKLIAGGACALIMLFASLSFASVAAMPDTSDINVVVTSLIFYAAALGAAFMAVIVRSRRGGSANGVD